MHCQSDDDMMFVCLFVFDLQLQTTIEYVIHGDEVFVCISS